MSVIDVRKDTTANTMTIATEWSAPISSVWQLWADPRKLERWWGPPTYPATVVDHQLQPGGSVTYFMTSPEGDKYHGWWKVILVDEPSRLDFEDGFADSDGKPDTTMPVTQSTVTFEEVSGGRTRMTIESRFASAEAMAKLLEMGMEEGLKQALGQIDAILAQA